MADDFEVIGKIVVDDAGRVTIQGLGDDIDKLSGHTGTLQNATSAFGDVARYVWANIVLEGVKAAIGAVVDFGKSTIQEAIEAQDVLANLNATLESTGYKAGMSSEQIQAMATELAGVTKFGEETILTGQAMLLTFTSIGKDVFPMATEAMLNLAQKMGGDVSGTAIQLGKALNDPLAGLTALRRVGVQFTDEQKYLIETLVGTGKALDDIKLAGVALSDEQIKMIKGMGEQVTALDALSAAGVVLTDGQKLQLENMKNGTGLAEAQKIILNELNVEFGGLAVAAGQTFSGQMAIANNRMGEAKEVIGNALMPVMGQFYSLMLGEIPRLESYAVTIANIATAFGTLLQTGSLTAFSDALKAIGGDDTPAFIVNMALAVDDLKATLDATLTAIQPGLENLRSFFNTVIPAITPILQNLGQTFTEVLGNIAATILPKLIEYFNKLSAWFNDNKEMIMTVLERLGLFLQILFVAVGELWKVIQPLLSGVLDLALNLGTLLLAIMSGDWEKALGALKDIFVDTFNAIVGSVAIIIEDLLAAFGTSTTEIAAGISKWWKELWDNFELGTSYTAAAVSNWWMSFWVEFDGGIVGVRNHVANWWTELWSNFSLGVSHTATAVADWWTELWSNFSLGVSHTATAIGDWWTEFWKNFNIGVDYVGTMVSNWWTELWNNFDIGIATIGQAIADTLNTWIDNAFKNMGIDKEAFLAQWADIFNSIGEIFDKLILEITTYVEGMWTQFWSDFRTGFNLIASPIADWWIEFWSNFDIGISYVSGKISDWWTELWANFDIGASYTAGKISNWWTELWSNFDIGVSYTADEISKWWSNVWSSFTDTASSTSASISTWWTELWSNFTLGVGATLYILSEWWSNVWSGFTAATAPIVTWWNTLWSNFSLGVTTAKSALTNWWSELWSNFSLGFGVVKTAVSNSINSALDNFTVGWTYVTDIGKSIVNGIVSGIQTTTGNLIQGITDAIQSMLNKVKNLLGIASPSSVFKDFGINIVQGLIDGWKDNFSNWISIIQTGINGIIDLFPDWLQEKLGIDGGNTINATASTGGGSSGGSSAGTGTNGGAQTVNNYFYGPVYFASSLDATNYDCPSPNPIIGASSNMVGGLAGGG